MSLFKNTSKPADTLPPGPHKLRDLGHKVTDSVLHPHMPESIKHLGQNVSEMSHHVSDAILHPVVSRCKACHAELQPHELAAGCCEDSEACGCRAGAARCW